MSGERLWSLDEGRLGRLPASIAHWTSATLFGLLGAAALLMVMRRLAGALPNPLEPAPLLAVAVIVAVGVFVIRLGWPVRSPAGEMSAAAWLAMLGTSLAVVALGTAVCAGGTHVVALFAFWTLLVLEESWAWQRILRRPKAEATGRSWRFWRRARPEAPVRPTTRATTAPPAAQTPPLARYTSELPPDEVLQHLVRSRAADGSDTLSGYARIAFAAGQRTGSIHVAFCPPFARTPELSIEQADGPDARIKMAQLLPYGVRLDLKLAVAAEQAASVLLQFMARGVEGHAENG